MDIRDEDGGSLHGTPFGAGSTPLRDDEPRAFCYQNPMTKLEDIERAETQLTPEQLAEFRDWFEAFDAARFDEKIARDAQSGRLDALAERAREDYRKGRAREL